MLHNEALMVRIQADDVSALQEVMDECWGPLVAYANRFLGDADLSEDMVQEAFLRLWSSRRDRPPSIHPRTFLYRVTRNLALNEQEHAAVRERWARTRQTAPAPSVPTPQEILESTEMEKRLEVVLAGLPERRREVFILARYHGHSYGEISEILEISPQTVANHMSRALRRIRAELRPFSSILPK